MAARLITTTNTCGEKGLKRVLPPDAVFGTDWRGPRHMRAGAGSE